MGGKGGDTDVYQSPYIDEADTLAFQTQLGLLSGQGISPSPAMNSSIVAQQLGGKYNPKTGEIKFGDGTIIRYDPVGGEFVSSSGGASFDNYKKYYQGGSTTSTAGGRSGIAGATSRSGAFNSSEDLQNYVNSGGKVYDSRGNLVNFAGGSNPYLTNANTSLGSIEENVYNNPSSAFNLFNSMGEKYYDPKTGSYVDATRDADGNTAPPAQLNADYYLNNYGGYLDQGYDQYDYNTVANISDTARANIYQRGADRIVANYKDRSADTDDFISRRGSSLSSGRAYALKDQLNEDKGRETTQLQRETDTEHELRTYDDAKRVRDLQGLEHRYGYEDTQKRGREKLGIAEALNSRNRDAAFQDTQANRQQNLSKMTALMDMLRVYGGMDSTAASLAAAQAQSSGAALGGLLGAVGQTAGGALARSD